MSAHPARQLGCPAKQFHVCFGRPPAGPVLSTAWLSCAVRERISCCLIYFCCSLCRVHPRFLHQDQPFCRLSLGLAVGRGLEVRELLHPSMTLERPHPSPQGQHVDTECPLLLQPPMKMRDKATCSFVNLRTGCQVSVLAHCC